MKRLILLFILAVGLPLHAQGPSATDKAEFSNLPEDQRKQFAALFQEAATAYQQKNIFEALEKIHQAERIFPDSTALLNLKGICYVEFRSFEKATAAFNRALEIDPQAPSVHFNLAEVAFVTHDWENALQRLEALLTTMDASEERIARLVEFKILLSNIKLGRIDTARKMAAKYDYMDDSPFYYYAQAAIATHDKKFDQAQQWLARAARVFRTPEIIGPWQDSLVEYNRDGDSTIGEVITLPEVE